MLSPTVLPRARVGDVIEEGVGFGGARVGMTDSELIGVWGDTILNHNPEGRYSVRPFRLSSGELLVVYLRNHRVGLIKFVITPSGGPLADAPLRTSRRAELGGARARVEAIYGIAEWQDEAYSADGTQRGPVAAPGPRLTRS
jgi:hypothetical protein